MQRKHLLRWRHIFLGAVFFAGCSAGVLYVLIRPWQQGLGPLPDGPFELASYSTALRTKAGFQGSVTRDEMGVVALSGMCENTAQLVPFEEELKARNIAYRKQTVCADELRRSVAWILHRNGYPDAQVSSGTTLDAIVITADPDLGSERWLSVSRQLSQLTHLRTWKVEAAHGDLPPSADKTLASKASVRNKTSSLSKPKTGILSSLFRSAGRISAWLGFPDQAGYWSVRALELSAQGISEAYISTVSQQYQIPLQLARAVIWIESRGRHTDAQGRILTSPKGALGIMQLMPDTARELKVNPFDARDNIRGGFAYLAQLARRYQGDWDKVIAAYNWGPRNIDQAVTRHGANWRIALPKESASYLAQMQGG